MRVRPLPAGVIAVLAAATVTTAVVLASSASAQVRANKWTVVPAARVSGGTTLAGVAAVNASNLWAVGSTVGPVFSDPHRPLVEHRTGSGWKRVPVPSVGAAGGDLRAVAAVSAKDVWAVGSAGDKPLALHFDGSRWKVTPVAANPAGEEPGGAFFAVAAVSSKDVWAVGTRPTPDGPGILIQHWNGRKWTFVAAPSQPPTDFNGLSGLAVVSARDIWAVGSRGDDFNEPLVEHWNGTAWQVVNVPELPQTNPDDPRDVGLTSVTAVSASNVWAVGEAGLIEHYDGHTWKIVSAPRPPGDTDGMSTRLASVSARSATDIWAVGTVNGAPVSLHFTGTAWALVPVPGGPSSLSGVVAVHGSGTTAVGTRTTSAGPRALILHNDR